MPNENNSCEELLLKPARLWSRADIRSKPCPVPKAPGVYAWYFRKVPLTVPVEKCVRRDDLTLLYIGISPTADPKNGKAPSRQTLYSRICYHMRGNAEGSILRLTLGCLLASELGIELRRVGSGKRMTFADGEKKLSQWLDRNAFVSWMVCAQPWVIEHELIQTICLPLNLDQNKAHTFHAQLSALRRSARERARHLPVWES